jgi:hypothetical protein
MTETALIIATALALILMLVTFSFVTVHFRLLRRGEDDRITLTVAWLRYLRYTVEVPLVDLLVQDTGPEIRLQTAASGRPEAVADSASREIRISLASLWDSHQRYKRYTFALRYLVRWTRISRFCWYSEIGTGEAHHTGLLTGIVWALKSTLTTGLFARTVLSEKPDLAVFPDYQQPRLNTFLDCIFKIRIGHIMIVALKAVRRK